MPAPVNPFTLSAVEMRVRHSVHLERSREALRHRAPAAPDLDAITLDVDAILDARARRGRMPLSLHIIRSEIRRTEVLIFALAVAAPLALMLAVL